MKVARHVDVVGETGQRQPLERYAPGIGLAFMGALTVGVHELLLGTERAWAKLGNTATEIPGFGSAPIEALGLTQYEAAAALGALAFTAIYLALFFLTFFYRWSED